MAVQIQQRGDTAANWTTADPVLADREVGWETDTGKLKLGDGVTAWTTLAYIGGGAGTGDFVGPASAVDGHLVVFDGTTGKLGKDGGPALTNPMTTDGDLIIGGASGAPTRLAAGATAGHVLTSNGSGAAPSYQAAGGGGGGAMVLIGSQTASGGATASMTVGSIPGTYNQLLIVFNGRGLTAANTVNLRLQFNGDTGANYAYERVFYEGGSAGASGNTAQNSAMLGILPAASSTANRSGTAQGIVANYAGTVFDKDVAWHSGHVNSTAPGAGVGSGIWHPATPVAITSVTALPEVGNFADGSKLYVYGIT